MAMSQYFWLFLFYPRGFGGNEQSSGIDDYLNHSVLKLLYVSSAVLKSSKLFNFKKCDTAMETDDRKFPPFCKHGFAK